MSVERSPLWGRLPPVAEATPEQLNGIRRAVEERARVLAARRRRQLRLIPGLMVGLGLLWWFLAGRAPPVPAASVTALERTGLERPARSSYASTPAVPIAPPPSALSEAPPAPVPLPVPPTVAPVRPHRVAAMVRRSPEHPDADDPEATLLGSALKQLRRNHDPQGALSVLETYQQEFPTGVLRPEAVMIRAESLVDLGRHQDLVDLLTPEAVADLPRSTELSLLRGEALSHLDRCREAIPLFSALLSASLLDEPAVDSSLRERALYGRALCRAHTGQVAAARRDLELEAAQFPEQAAKARRTLETLQGP